MEIADTSWESEEFNPDTNFGVMNADQLRRELRKAIWVIEERLPAFESANAEMFDSLVERRKEIEALEAEVERLQRKVFWHESVGLVQNAERLAKQMIAEGLVK
jgi:predicted RNase H-like nuclease (RuvC/YqgF family)